MTPTLTLRTSVIKIDLFLHGAGHKPAAGKRPILARRRKARRPDASPAEAGTEATEEGQISMVSPELLFGMTDDFGIDIIKDPCHVHDYHATVLHIMGIDHKKLTYRYSGRDFRLTDVHGNVLHSILV
jgi:hypothetical protein